MALVQMEGFDNYNNVAVDLPAAGSMTVTAPGGLVAGRNTPGKALSFGTSGNLVNQTVLAPTAQTPKVTTMTLGFAMAQKSLTATGPTFYVIFYPNTTLGSANNGGLFRIQFAADGSVSMTYGPNASTVGPTSLGKPNLDTQAPWSGIWHYYEIQAICGSGQVCSFTVKIDGVNVLASGNLNFSILGWSGYGMTATGGLYTYIDDVYLCNDQGTDPSYATFLGICQITTLFPTASGTYSQFSPVPSSNANWQNASEVADDGDTSYNTASNPGTKDTFHNGSGQFTGGQTILAVQPMISVRQDDSPTARSIQTYVRSGSTEHGGATKVLKGSYSFSSDILTTDPATGSAWSAGGVNGLEFGYNIVS